MGKEDGEEKQVEVLFGDEESIHGGTWVRVSVHGVTREPTLADLHAFIAARGLSAEDVTVTIVCDCAPVYGGFSERYIELAWKADTP